MSEKFRIFARLFEYPSRELIEFIEKTEAPEINLNEFKERIIKLPMSQLEEIYTRTFDLQAICYPYAGYQLFGEDYRRGEFMAKLKEEYRSSGFVPPEDELPDHIRVIFLYLSYNPSDTVLIEECLLPVFEKFLDSFKENTDNPYYFLLKAIHESIKSEALHSSEFTIDKEGSKIGSSEAIDSSPYNILSFKGGIKYE